MVYIYILRLRYNKFYVGKTTNPKFRLDDHFNSEGSQWTKQYPPVQLEGLIPNCDVFDEDKYTLKYMEIYGIANVRGGSFCSIKLTDNDKKHIKKMLDGATDKCYKCGQSGHYANKCSQNKDVICYKCDQIGHYADKCTNDVKCSKCLRYGHHTNKCKIKICSKCHKEGHISKDCYVRQTVKQNDGYFATIGKYIDKFISPVCYRCGRDGHYSNNCYAKTTIDGYKLN